jgi:hypothetical protein
VLRCVERATFILNSSCELRATATPTSRLLLGGRQVLGGGGGGGTPSTAVRNSFLELCRPTTGRLLRKAYRTAW